ncbi:pentapeptide repeat-containing protein [Haladaptatus sp. DFWS20]|uniref:pentapeptide repeat-containing protein n=1 Tax=Haladaptatus sp. DFWS20 TaxID=3403467 RepID=UPI003EC0AB8D
MCPNEKADTNRCEYKFPEANGNSGTPSLLGAESLNEENRWECKRDVKHDRRCIFHLSKKQRQKHKIKDTDIRDKLVKEINNPNGADESQTTGDGEPNQKGQKGTKTDGGGDSKSGTTRSKNDESGNQENGSEFEKIKENKQFIGAKFGNLDLSNMTLGSKGDNYAIDLRHAEVDGEMSLRRAEVTNPIYLAGISIEKSANFKFSSFRDNVAFEHMTFKGDVDFSQAGFESGVDFLGTEFVKSAFFEESNFRSEQTYFIQTTFNGGFDDGRVADFENATFERRVYFSGTTFNCEADFKNAEFREDALFREMTDEEKGNYKKAAFSQEFSLEDQRTVFKQAATFDQATFISDSNFQDVIFRGRAQFEQVIFERRAIFMDTMFKGPTSFADSEFMFNTDFEDATFKADVSFEDVVFNRKSTIRNTEFRGEANFTNTIFERRARFENTRFRHPPKFKRAEFRRRFTFVPESIEWAGRINLQRASIETGELQQPPAGVVYDLKDAELGNVKLSRLNERNTANIFDQYEFINTSFTGFDFGEYRTDLKNNGWNIHSSENPRRIENCEPETLEVTYLKAKNGANRVGDSTAAAKFFQKEMRYRGKTYTQNNGRYWNIWNRIRRNQNRVLWATSSYGESPTRTFFSSIALIVIFGLLYFLVSYLVGQPIPQIGANSENLVAITVNETTNQSVVVTQVGAGGDTGGNTAGIVQKLQNAGELSIQAFVSLIIGVPSIDTPYRILVYLEAFLGAFFIALFLFTLTRSIHR